MFSVNKVTINAPLTLIDSIKPLYFHYLLDKLALFNNEDLTGTIPKAIGKLEELGILYLDHTKLLPNVPREICTNLETLQEFWADCDELNGCECCTTCCNEENGCDY